MSAPKMMPGQTPYTDAELRRLSALVGSACVAQEIIGEDELEWNKQQEDRRRMEEKKLPVAKQVRRSPTVHGLGVGGTSLVKLDLAGCEQNIFAVMARVRRATEAAGWTQQKIGDFRGALFKKDNNDGFEAAMKLVRTSFLVENAPF